MGAITLDEAARRVTVNGRNVDLSPREFSLLEALMRHPGQTLTRDQLLDHAWPFSVAVTPNAVDAYVHYLRTKLGEAGLAGRDGPRRGLPARRWLTASGSTRATTTRSRRPSPTRRRSSGASAGASWRGAACPRWSCWWCWARPCTRPSPARSRRRPSSSSRTGRGRWSRCSRGRTATPATGPSRGSCSAAATRCCTSSMPQGNPVQVGRPARSSCRTACPRRRAGRGRASADGTDVRTATLELAAPFAGPPGPGQRPRSRCRSAS